MWGVYLAYKKSKESSLDPQTLIKASHLKEHIMILHTIIYKRPRTPELKGVNLSSRYQAQHLQKSKEEEHTKIETLTKKINITFF